MKIASWNVNGLRACARKGFAEWLEASRFDVVALQEVRSRADQLSAELTQRPGWHFHLHAAERPGYSGVALYSKRRPEAVDHRFDRPEFDREGRLQLARFGDLWLANGYFPNGNGKERDLSRIPYKLDFYRWLFDLLEPERAAGRPVLVMGDFNTAHREIDLARPRENRETSGFRPEEREELDRWLRSGWSDTFRLFESGAGHYSWWSQRQGVREKGIGWRLDYVLASPGALPFLKKAAIHPEVMGSDHCPVSVELDRKILGTKKR
ncbi:MAG TPA: exodeoxyribonuclease III [Thermoanaerobaculia bacterium]|nr:exodeoxyribonuclease III [Thermoanaerobaculia bacterium]